MIVTTNLNFNPNRIAQFFRERYEIDIEIFLEEVKYVLKTVDSFLDRRYLFIEHSRPVFRFSELNGSLQVNIDLSFCSDIFVRYLRRRLASVGFSYISDLKSMFFYETRIVLSSK